MANICGNKFQIYSENPEIIKTFEAKLKSLFDDYFEGYVEYCSEECLEGWFDSKWVFPTEKFEELTENNQDDTLEIRCLSEEYGCGYVAMNIYKNLEWWDEQTFEL